MDGSFKVTKNTFENLPVSLTGSMHELIKFVDGKGDVRTCKCQVLEGTYNLAIGGNINC